MSAIRLLAVIEAVVVTGPAKNLLQFGYLARSSSHPVELGIATFVRGQGSNRFIDAAHAAGLTVFPIPEAGRFDRSVFESLKAAAVTFGAELVQSHAVKSHFCVRLSGLHMSVPWVAFHHGYTWPDWRARLYNLTDWWSLRAATKAITVSQPFREQLTSRGVPADRIEVVHNAVEPQWGWPKDPERRRLRDLGIPTEAFVLLIVGRLSAEKDHLTLLRAVAAVRKKVPRPLHLLIVGEGPARPAIESCIEALQLRQSVTLTGEQASRPFYEVVDAAVLSSLSEGSPNALLEAMAAGLPTVATRVGGIPEIATDGETALLVPPGDADAMSAAILKVVENVPFSTTLGQRARAVACASYQPQTRANRLCEIYSGIARGRPGGTVNG